MVNIPFSKKQSYWTRLSSAYKADVDEFMRMLKPFFIMIALIILILFVIILVVVFSHFGWIVVACILALCLILALKLLSL